MEEARSIHWSVVIVECKSIHEASHSKTLVDPVCVRRSIDLWECDHTIKSLADPWECSRRSSRRRLVDPRGQS